MNNSLVNSYVSDVNLMFNLMVNEFCYSNESKIEAVCKLFDLNFDSVKKINMFFNQGNLNFSISEMILEDYKSSLALTGDSFCFQEFISEFNVFHDRYLPAISLLKNFQSLEDSSRLTGLSIDTLKSLQGGINAEVNNSICTEKLGVLAYRSFVNNYVINVALSFFGVIERTSVDDLSSLGVLATLFSIDFDHVLYIKQHQSKGNLNYQIFIFVFNEYSESIRKNKSYISFSSFISDFSKFFGNTLLAIQLINLGASRETVCVLTDRTLENVKLLRSILNLKVVSNVINQTIEDSYDVFSFIENRYLEYYGVFSEESSKQDLILVLLRISKDLLDNDMSQSPFSHLWTTLLYHHTKGSLVNRRTNTKFYCSLLSERIDNEYRKKNMQYHKERFFRKKQIN